MRRELSATSRRLRSVAFFVTAGLLLSGCVRVTYNTTLGADGKASGYVENLITDDMTVFFDEFGVYPTSSTVQSFSYDSWSQDTVAHTCTLSNPLVTINNARFNNYQPGGTVLLYNLNMANAADATYGTDINFVVTGEENVALQLKDIVIAGGCTDPGAWVSGGDIAAGENLFGSNDPATDDSFLKTLSHIPAVDRAYMYALAEFELSGTPYGDYMMQDPNDNTLMTELTSDMEDHQLAVGELPARLDELESMDAIRKNGARGIRYYYENMPIVSASATSNAGLNLGPVYRHVGNEWVMTMDYPDTNGEFSGFATPSSSASAYMAQRELDALSSLAFEHYFTIVGVVTDTNGDYNATNNSIDFGVSVNSKYQFETKTIAPKLSSVLGTVVKFSYKKKSLSKEGKAAVKRAKSGLLKAKKITIVGILDGTKTTAGEKRRVKLLAQARAKALGKYLANLGVTAKVTYSYSTLKKSNIDAVIKAGQRRAVIQVIN